MKGIEIMSTKPSQQLAELAGIDGDEDVWQHDGTRAIVIGDVGTDDAYTRIGSVAEYRQELRALLKAR